MFIKIFFPFTNLATLAFKASIPAPPLPITTPGLAVYIFNLTLEFLYLILLYIAQKLNSYP